MRTRPHVGARTQGGFSLARSARSWAPDSLRSPRRNAPQSRHIPLSCTPSLARSARSWAPHSLRSPTECAPIPHPVSLIRGSLPRSLRSLVPARLARRSSLAPLASCSSPCRASWVFRLYARIFTPFVPCHGSHCSAVAPLARHIPTPKQPTKHRPPATATPSRSLHR